MNFECPKCRKAGAIDDIRVPESGLYATCPNCKERFIVTKNSEFIFEPITITSPQKKTEVNNVSSSGPSGIGGWLKFIVISLMYIGPVMTLSIVNDIFKTEDSNSELIKMEGWPYYKNYIYISIFCFSLLSFYGGWNLKHNKSKTTIKNVIIVLWSLGPLFRLIIEVIIPLLNLGAAPNSYTTASARILGSCIAPLIATIYLLKSSRVRNTYIENNVTNQFDNIFGPIIFFAIFMAVFNSSAFSFIFNFIREIITPLVGLLPTSPPNLSGNSIHFIGVTIFILVGFLIYKFIKD